MKKLLCLLFVVASFTCFPTAWGLEAPVRHEFVIKNFKTESGVVLPEAHVVYGTYGHLNAARDNAVLLPSHYMAKLNGYEWLMGPDKALDPEKLFLVTTELFGNGSSSSPSNTPEPFHGHGFRVMTIRDNVEARAPVVDRGTACDASEGGDRVFDGGAAGVSVGGELSRFYGSRGRDVRHGEDVWTWDCSAGGGDCCNYCR